MGRAGWKMGKERRRGGRWRRAERRSGTMKGMGRLRGRRRKSLSLPPFVAALCYSWFHYLPRVLEVSWFVPHDQEECYGSLSHEESYVPASVHWSAQCLSWPSLSDWLTWSVEPCSAVWRKSGKVSGRGSTWVIQDKRLLTAPRWCLSQSGWSAAEIARVDCRELQFVAGRDISTLIPVNDHDKIHGIFARIQVTRDSWDSGLPLSDYQLSLTGAKIFAFDICLENRTNFEEKKFSFDSLLISSKINIKICVILPINFKR